MTRYLPFVVLVGVLAAIAAITPATASANDAAVVTSVKLRRCKGSSTRTTAASS